jgi:hypothetical protein
LRKKLVNYRFVRNTTFPGAAWFPVVAIFVATLATGCGTHGEKASGAKNAAPVAVDLTFSPAPETSASGLKDSDLSHAVAAGTTIPVTLMTSVDSSSPNIGIVVGIVEADVKGADGRVALPAGSSVALAVRGYGKKGRISELTLGIYAINVLGRELSFTNGQSDAATLIFTEDAGLGVGHTSVHLYRDQSISFKLDRAVQLR